jgi:hypothetical protein
MVRSWIADCHRLVTRLLNVAKYRAMQPHSSVADSEPPQDLAGQGTRTPSSFAALYGIQHFGEIDGDLGNRQQTAGKWALELPELSAMYKSALNDAKAFMSRQQEHALNGQRQACWTLLHFDATMLVPLRNNCADMLWLLKRKT